MSLNLTRRATGAIIRSLAELSPGTEKDLWSSIRAVTRDDQRDARKRLRCRAATQEDHAVVSELRTEVIAAYLLLDATHREQIPALRLVLQTGDTAKAAEGSGVPLRKIQRWVPWFLKFAAAYLSREVKAARAAIMRDQERFEAQLESAKGVCRQICNPEDLGGTFYKSEGGGCEACPLHLVG